jgi:hypothetical protein
MHFARKIPTVPVQRRIDVGQVRSLRQELPRRPSWCVLFTKAYAQVCAEMPELRRSYLSFPRPRLYEHAYNVASVAIERQYQGENAVFFAHLRSPEQQGLGALDDHLHRFQHEPIADIGLFRRALFMSRLPRFLRRFLWWFGLNSSGAKRAKRMGTFGVSVYSHLGAESLHPLSPLTTTLNYGVIQPDGTVNARIIYDHRVMDGSTVARALARLEQVLQENIAAELRDLRHRQAA